MKKEKIKKLLHSEYFIMMLPVIIIFTLLLIEGLVIEKPQEQPATEYPLYISNIDKLYKKGQNYCCKYLNVIHVAEEQYIIVYMTRKDYIKLIGLKKKIDTMNVSEKFDSLNTPDNMKILFDGETGTIIDK